MIGHIFSIDFQTLRLSNSGEVQAHMIIKQARKVSMVSNIAFELFLDINVP